MSRSGSAHDTVSRNATGELSAALALRAARERAGLSRPQLARKLGVAIETVRAAELGRPLRHSTLMACLRTLPGLAARDLLADLEGLPTAAPAGWSRLRELHGFSAARCRVELRTTRAGLPRLSIAVDDVRTACGLACTEPVALALMRAVAWAENGTLAQLATGPRLPSRHRRLVVNDARGEHAFWVVRQGADWSVSYRCTGPAESADRLEMALDYCVEELELAIVPAGNRRDGVARCAVRPETIPPDDARPDLARLMHPSASAASRRQGAVSWAIPRPLPGFAYSLDCGSGEPVPARPRRWSLATTLRRARESAGLSLRDVAAIARVCHASVAYAELGRDPRLHALRGYVRAIPSLAPQDVLPAECPNGVLTDLELWEQVRDLYGYDVREITKTLIVAADGSSTNVIETCGLRPLRGDLREMRIRTGLHRAVAQVSPSVLQEVESDLTQLRIRTVRKSDGPVVHEFKFPARLASGALTHVRTYSGPRYPVAPDASGDEDTYAGVGLPVYHPARRVRLVVRLPRRLEPRWIRAFTWPACVVPDADLPMLSPHLPSPPCSVGTERDATVVTSVLERPQIGLRLGIAWGPPS